MVIPRHDTAHNQLEQLASLIFQRVENDYAKNPFIETCGSLRSCLLNENLIHSLSCLSSNTSETSQTVPFPPHLDAVWLTVHALIFALATL